MNGLELIRLARAVDPDLACIAVTGQGSEHVAVEIMKAGAADYLVKPFEPAAICAAVRRAIEDRRFRSSRLYRDITQDLAAKNALLEKRMEQLSRRMSETSTLYEAAGMHCEPKFTFHTYEKELRPGVDLMRRE